MGAPPALSYMRPRGLLRGIAEQTRDQTFSPNAAPGHPELRAGRGLGLLLRGRRDVRADAYFWIADDRPRVSASAIGGPPMRFRATAPSAPRPRRTGATCLRSR